MCFWQVQHKHRGQDCKNQFYTTSFLCKMPVHAAEIMNNYFKKNKPVVKLKIWIKYKIIDQVLFLL